MNKDDNIHKEEAHLQWTNEQVYTFSCFYKKEREYALNLEEKIKKPLFKISIFLF